MPHYPSNRDHHTGYRARRRILLAVLIPATLCAEMSEGEGGREREGGGGKEREGEGGKEREIEGGR